MLEGCNGKNFHWLTFRERKFVLSCKMLRNVTTWVHCFGLANKATWHWLLTFGNKMNCHTYTKFVVLSQALLYRHSLNVCTSMLWSVCFVPEKTESLYIFSKFNTLNTETPLMWTLQCQFFISTCQRVSPLFQ